MTMCFFVIPMSKKQATKKRNDANTLKHDRRQRTDVIAARHPREKTFDSVELIHPDFSFRSFRRIFY